MPDVVRIGVVGAGSISVRGILPHLSQDDVKDRVVLTAICDPVPGRAVAAAERFGARLAFTDYDDLLAKGEVDAVTIASPIGIHYEQGMKALRAGKHVHFNKTMTTTVAEATEIIDLAAKKGLKLTACPGQALRPHIQKIRRLIADGAIGEVVWTACGATFGAYHETESVRLGDDVLMNTNPAWYWRKPGGGPLYDMTVYALHSLTAVLGPAKRVTAMSGVRIKEREFRGEKYVCDADDNTLMVLDYGDGLFSLVYGVAAGRLTEGFEANYFGTKGSIVGMKLNDAPLDYPGRPEVDAIEATGKRAYPLLPHVVGPHREIQEAHVFEDIMQLVDLIREGKSTPSTAEHARHVIDIIESAYRAAETGQTQELRTTFAW
jgi:predicted dehydrogenase